MTAFPFSASTRVEFSGGGRALTFTRDAKTRVFDVESGELIERRSSTHRGRRTALPGRGERRDRARHVVLRRDQPDLRIARTGSRWGRRPARCSTRTSLADWRRYFMPARPFTIAVRGLHYGRYGRNSQHPQLLDLFVGYPELVHGYGIGIVFGRRVRSSRHEPRVRRLQQPDRQPHAGRQRRSARAARRPVHAASSNTAGSRSRSRLSSTRASPGPPPPGRRSRAATRDVVRSAGGAVRVNAFGLLIVEVAASRPFDRIDRSWQWQIGIRQSF